MGDTAKRLAAGRRVSEAHWRLQRAVRAAAAAGDIVGELTAEGYAADLPGLFNGVRAEARALRTVLDAIEARLGSQPVPMPADAVAGVRVLADVPEAAADLVAEARPHVEAGSRGRCARCRQPATPGTVCAPVGAPGTATRVGFHE